MRLRVSRCPWHRLSSRRKERLRERMASPLSPRGTCARPVRPESHTHIRWTEVIMRVSLIAAAISAALLAGCAAEGTYYGDYGSPYYGYGYGYDYGPSYYGPSYGP